MARAGLTAERVTLAAADIADQIGFDAVTVSAVARALGVKDPSLYSHVKSAQQLRERIALLALTELANVVASAIAGRSGKDALVAFAGGYRNYAKEFPGRYAASQMQLDPEVAAASAALKHSQMTRALLRQYNLEEPDETDAIRFLHSTFHGYVSLERGGGFQHSPRSADASWESLLNALDLILRTWPSVKLL